MSEPTENIPAEPASRAAIRRSRDRDGAPDVPMMPLSDGSYIIRPQALRPEHLTTAEECSTYMIQMDRLAADLRAKLDHIREVEAAGECDDPSWYRRTERLLRDVKIARVVATERRGFLSRREKAAAHEAHEARERTKAERFIAAARLALPPEQYLDLWRLADEYAAAV
jgi:hypothetical protein